MTTVGQETDARPVDTPIPRQKRRHEARAMISAVDLSDPEFGTVLVDAEPDRAETRPPAATRRMVGMRKPPAPWWKTESPCPPYCDSVHSADDISRYHDSPWLKVSLDTSPEPGKNLTPGFMRVWLRSEGGVARVVIEIRDAVSHSVRAISVDDAAVLGTRLLNLCDVLAGRLEFIPENEAAQA